MSVPSSDGDLEIFRQIVDQAPDAIIFADRLGVIQAWNNAATDLFGYPADEVIGRSLDVIIPEHLRHAHWEGLKSGGFRANKAWETCSENPSHP